MGDRISFNEMFLQVAEVVSQRGTCDRLQVGAVIVSPHWKIVSTGYNGAPRGLSHCRHSDYPYTNAHGVTFTDPNVVNGHCTNAEHSERNSLIHAGRDAFGGYAYLTVSPCLPCARMMVTAGLSRVYFRRWYENTEMEAVKNLFISAGIQWKCVPREDSEKR